MVSQLILLFNARGLSVQPSIKKTLPTSAVSLASVRIERLGRSAEHVLGDVLSVAGGRAGRVGQASDEGSLQDW